MTPGIIDWTGGFLTYKGTTYEIAAGGTDKKYIYWDPNYTTIFRETDNLQDVFDCEGWLMCINDEGTAYPAYSLRTIHGAIIQAGTLIVGTADIENLAVTTAKIDDLAVETIKIKDHAVTFPMSAYTEGSVSIPRNTQTTIQTISNFISMGDFITIFGRCSIGGVGLKGKFQIYRDSTKIWEDTNDLTYQWSDNFNADKNMIFSESPDAGTYEYTLRFLETTASGSPGTITQRALIIQEMKK